MKIYKRLIQRLADARDAKKFANLLAEVDADWDFSPEGLKTQSEALEEFVCLIATREGIRQVLRRYEMPGISDTDRLKDLYRMLMSHAAGPPIGGRQVHTMVLYDPHFLMFILQKQAEGLNGIKLGVAAWEFAKQRLANSE